MGIHITDKNEVSVQGMVVDGEVVVGGTISYRGHNTARVGADYFYDILKSLEGRLLFRNSFSITSPGTIGMITHGQPLIIRNVNREYKNMKNNIYIGSITMDVDYPKLKDIEDGNIVKKQIKDLGLVESKYKEWIKLYKSSMDYIYSGAKDYFTTDVNGLQKTYSDMVDDMMDEVERRMIGQQDYLLRRVGVIEQPEDHQRNLLYQVYMNNKDKE